MGFVTEALNESFLYNLEYCSFYIFQIAESVVIAFGGLNQGEEIGYNWLRISNALYTSPLAY